MTAPAPIAVRWDGDAFVPISQRFARQADKDFVIGEVYHMVVEEPRSANSHKHYFAAITEAWRNLPESMDGRFPTADHLRSFALCMTGYRDERHIVCSSRAEALRLAAFIRPMDEFAIVSVDAACVTVWTAKSQNLRAMNKATFQASKTAVLAYLADMLSVPADVLRRQGEAA